MCKITDLENKLNYLCDNHLWFFLPIAFSYPLRCCTFLSSYCVTCVCFCSDLCGAEFCYADRRQMKQTLKGPSAMGESVKEEAKTADRNPDEQTFILCFPMPTNLTRWDFRSSFNG